MVEQRHFDFPELERKAVPELWSVDEIYSGLDHENFSKFNEDQRLERKPPGIHADSLATYVCMWANTPPDGGLIAVGLEDGTGKASDARPILRVSSKLSAIFAGNWFPMRRLKRGASLQSTKKGSRTTYSYIASSIAATRLLRQIRAMPTSAGQIAGTYLPLPKFTNCKSNADK